MITSFILSSLFLASCGTIPANGEGENTECSKLALSLQGEGPVGALRFHAPVEAVCATPVKKYTGSRPILGYSMRHGILVASGTNAAPELVHRWSPGIAWPEMILGSALAGSRALLLEPDVFLLASADGELSHIDSSGKSTLLEVELNNNFIQARVSVGAESVIFLPRSRRDADGRPLGAEILYRSDGVWESCLVGNDVIVSGVVSNSGDMVALIERREDKTEYVALYTRKPGPASSEYSREILIDSNKGVENLTAIAISGKGDRLAVGVSGGIALISTSTLASEEMAVAGGGAVTALAFDPSGNKLAFGDTQGNLGIVAERFDGVQQAANPVEWVHDDLIEDLTWIGDRDMVASIDMRGYWVSRGMGHAA